MTLLFSASVTLCVKLWDCSAFLCEEEKCFKGWSISKMICERCSRMLLTVVENSQWKKNVCSDLHDMGM